MILLKDRQRERCYRWQEDFIAADSPQSTDQLNHLFNHLSSVFLLTDIHLEMPEKCRKTYSYQKGNKIMLHPSTRTFTTLSHEFAHLALWHWFVREGHSIEIHGPEWLTLYMLLLNKVCGLDLQNLLESASRHKLRCFPEILRGYCD